MNLSNYVSIHSGGAGSGCKGPNCGRPSTGTKAQQTSGKQWAKMSAKEREAYLKEHTKVGDKPAQATKPKLSPAEKIYPHSGKGSMGVGKPAGRQPDERLGKITGPAGSKANVERPGNISPLYKKSFDEAERQQEKAGQAEMRQWQKQNQPSSNQETAINKGDLVKTTKVTRAFNNNTLEFQQYKAGTVLTVHNVLPKVGNNPQMLSVQYPQGDMLHMPVTDVMLHRTRESLQEKPYQQIRQEIGLDKGIRPGRIEQQIQTPTGAKYTKLKPVAEGRPQGSGNIWKQGQPSPDEHPLKGKFSSARGPKGNELKEVFTFDLNMKSFGQGAARASVYDANYTARTPAEAKYGTAGTTVIAWRDTVNKTGRVMEFNRDANGFIKIGSQPAQQFRNLGHMASYLNQRYGISMKLPGSSVAKKGRKK